MKKSFMDKDFLLNTETAVRLYSSYAHNMPIIDYHCHLDPREIYEDRKFDTITQVWLGGDHYKWRIMRAHGIEEQYITGDADDREKFRRWAKTLSMAIGNPLYHWTHLELRMFFDYQGVLNAATANEVYDLCNEKLRTMTARQMIRQAGVTHICTTDDPADDLQWHKKIREDDSFDVRVLPAWRPDAAMNITKDSWQQYIERLGQSADTKIISYDSLIRALKNRMEFFAENGCVLSDHGMDYVMYEPYTAEEINTIFSKRLNNEELSEKEIRKYRTAFLTDMGREYADKGWAMQLHYGVIRDNNKKIFKALGADAGIDSIGNSAPLAELAQFLNSLAETDELPKTIIYSLNPIDNTAIETIMACFQDSSCVCKIQHGSAWWFNDHKKGMIDQMTSLAEEGMLADFVGMLTDSRSFLSYARHDYFRRILCELIGQWVENGEYPDDEEALKTIVEGICYNNARRYFGF